MNIAEFIDSYRDSIASQVIASYPPLYQPSELRTPLPRLLRRPMGGQAAAIRGTALSLQAHPGTIVVGEMGTGKTFIAAAAAHLAGFRRIIVVCPPHLTPKWKREVEQTIPSATAVIVSSITDLEKSRRILTMGPVFIILSRERAKLSYQWKPAVVERYARLNGQLLRDEETYEPFTALHCPDCNHPAVDKEGLPVSWSDVSRRKHVCARCGTPLWCADNHGPRRYPLSEYIKHRFRGHFDLFIGDEVHEYKERGSAQGIAAGVLAEAAGRSLTLTGTLMGGYASTLFHLLYRFSPAIRSTFEHNQDSRWVDAYGFREYTISKDDDVTFDGRSSRRRGRRKQVKERPGVSPSVLFHLIGNTVFLRLADVASDLPPYREQVIVSPLSHEPAHYDDLTQAGCYRKVYTSMRKAMKDALQDGSKRLLSIYLQATLAYPDACTQGETIIDPVTNELLVQVPPLEQHITYPKEQALVDLIKREKAEGRRVLVYCTHTGRRDVTSRVRDVLRSEGFNAAVLYADTVPPDKREGWVEHQVSRGIDVLICHPRLVQTGLDLLQFPTICWFETEYSVYTMRQASRRSWRIGQQHDVRVIYMAYAHTVQADALQLVARKLQASLAIEGELPEQGLATHGDDGDDLILALAKRIVNGETDDGAIEELFAHANSIEAEAEEFLVSDDWHVDEPEPEPPPPAPVVQSVMTWDDFLRAADAATPMRRGRRTAQPQASMSMFEWAVQEQEVPA